MHLCAGQPHEKMEKVQALVDAGEYVMMVGDGTNDAPALSAASVGVSIGVNDLASEAADVVLLNQLKDPTESLVELV